jgi:DNA-binding transcriptional MocR family regulator
MPHKVDPELTPLYCKVYAAVREAIAEYGESPSQGELRIACNCSMLTVNKALKKLRAKGYIEFEKFGPRTARPINVNLTLSHEPVAAWDLLTPQKKYWQPEAAS